jgi:CMP-N,N'-diacetyllegionaminic acid synthase
MSVVAFIPARGGSKGIPRKNLAPLAGRPLIQWTIDAVRESRTVDDIFLSSDDEEIIAFCRSIGVDVPYVRPPELAMDNTSMFDTVRHALEWMADYRSGGRPDDLLLLQPTSPLRTAEDIDGAVRQFRDTGVTSLISVHEMSEHPYECLRLAPDGWGFLAKPEGKALRRQDYADRYYFINGAMYLAKTRFILEEGLFFKESESGIYVMPPERGLDIDQPWQIPVAEALWKYGRN